MERDVREKYDIRLPFFNLKCYLWLDKKKSSTFLSGSPFRKKRSAASARQDAVCKSARSFPPLGIDVPAVWTPCRQCLRNRTEFHKPLGGRSSSSASAIPRKRRRARDERERSGENARFHSHWLEKMRLYGVVMCARNVHTRGSCGTEVPRYVCKDMLNASTYVSRVQTL